MPPQWSPEPWKYRDGFIQMGPSPYEEVIAEVYGRRPEEVEANGRLMTAAPEAARLLALLYPYAPMALREQIYTWASKAGVTLEDLDSSGPPATER